MNCHLFMAHSVDLSLQQNVTTAVLRGLMLRRDDTETAKGRENKFLVATGLVSSSFARGVAELRVHFARWRHWCCCTLWSAFCLCISLEHLLSPGAFLLPTSFGLELSYLRWRRRRPAGNSLVNWYMFSLSSRTLHAIGTTFIGWANKKGTVALLW